MSLKSFIILGCLVAAAAAFAQPTPTLFLSLRGISDRTVEVGEPVFVGVRLEAPEGASTFKFAPGRPAWTDAIAVELHGAAKTIRAVTATVGAADLDIGAETAGGAVWYFSSQEMATLPPGTYQLRARVETTGAAKESADDPGTELRIVAAPSPNGAVQRAVALASEALLKRQPEQAANILDSLLETNPDHPRLLLARAQVCVAGEDWAGAALCLERGIAKAEAASRGYPPIALTQFQQELMLHRLAAGPATTQPPSWTRLPEKVLVRDWAKGPAGAGRK